MKRQVDVRANTAILTQLVANLEMAKVTLRKETPLIQIIYRPIMLLEKKKKSKSVTAVQWVFSVALFITIFLLVSSNGKK